MHTPQGGITLLEDLFETSVPAGKVLGSACKSGHARIGADKEHVLSVDGGALRVAPLIEAGWGRSTLAYGPLPFAAGTVLAVSILNGHNTSQAEPLSERFGDRVLRWVMGPHQNPSLHTRFQRLRELVSAQRFDRLARQFLCWFRTDERTRTVPRLDDNLAVGFFTDPQAAAPQGRVAFTMQALGPQNGALAVSLGQLLPTQVVRGVQNLPLLLVVLVREDSVVYAVASLPGAPGLGPGWPKLRPLAIGPLPLQPPAFVGIAQAVLGQIGFRADSRAMGVRVVQDPVWGAWAAGAVVADRLTAQDPIALPLGEGFVREREGTRLQTQMEALQLQSAEVPVGLLRVSLNLAPQAHSGAVGLVFRGNANEAWLCATDGQSFWLAKRTAEGKLAERARAPAQALNGVLQVLDDGHTLTVLFDGRSVFAAPVEDTHHAQNTGVGLWAAGDTQGISLRDFEALPRALVVPCAQSLPWPSGLAAHTPRLHDAFVGTGDLSNHRCAQGIKWRRVVGKGQILVHEQGGAQVVGSVLAPSPDRTIYALPWPAPDLAELSVRIHAPGSGRAQGEKSRGGVVFWQDDRNYIIVSVYLDDHYGGASISSFFQLDGYEDLYDAVWTNVGNRVSWGQSFVLRVIFDGQTYQAFVNDEPVLFRRLSDVYPNQGALQIRRVGLVANWEWGQDTGTLFNDFAASSR